MTCGNCGAAEWKEPVACCAEMEGTEVKQLREQNAKLQATILEMLTCRFTYGKCDECYGKAKLALSEGDTA